MKRNGVGIASRYRGLIGPRCRHLAEHGWTGHFGGSPQPAPVRARLAGFGPYNRRKTPTLEPAAGLYTKLYCKCFFFFFWRLEASRRWAPRLPATVVPLLSEMCTGYLRCT